MFQLVTARSCEVAEKTKSTFAWILLVFPGLLVGLKFGLMLDFVRSCL